jgi:hypothetical protein
VPTIAGAAPAGTKHGRAVPFIGNQPGITTKDWKKKVSGVRPEFRHWQHGVRGGLKNEGASGDVDENKGEGVKVPGNQVSGVRPKTRCRALGAKRQGPDTNHWQHNVQGAIKNEGASGDVDENKGPEKKMPGDRPKTRCQVPGVSSKTTVTGVRCQAESVAAARSERLRN